MRNLEQGECAVLIGCVKVVVAEEKEQLVLEDRSAHRAACHPLMQLRVFILRQDLSQRYVLFIEKGICVESVCAAHAVDLSMKVIRAAGCDHSDVRAAGLALLRIVHGGGDADLLKELGRWRGETVAVGAVDRDIVLRLAAGGAAFPDIELITL